MRGALRLTAYVLVTLLGMPFQLAAVGLRWRGLAVAIPLRYHRIVCWIFGLKVEVHGTRSTAVPTLFVSNHISYLDIEVLGSVLPASFVAKAEVSTWPFFSWLAKLQRTVFVERVPRAARGSRDEMVERLAAGDSLILFPEGTSGDGQRVLPFRTSLFAVAGAAVGDRPLCVQPVTIAYTRLDGIPLGRYWRPFFAWFGDMELAGHLWNVTKLGEASVVVVFHEPTDIAAIGDRKKLAAHCERLIATTLQTLNRDGGTASLKAPAPVA